MWDECYTGGRDDVDRELGMHVSREVVGAAWESRVQFSILQQLHSKSQISNRKYVAQMLLLADF